MHARFFDPVPFFPFSADMLLLLFVLLCARISIYNVWVCANEINSVALEAKIYYQIKFLTEFIALSLSPNIVLLPFGSLHSPLPTTHKQPPPQPPTQMNPPANEPSHQTPNPSNFGVTPTWAFCSCLTFATQFALPPLCTRFPYPFLLYFWVFLFIKFIENKFGQYAHIIFACFWNISG